MTRYNFGGLLNPTQSGGLLSDNLYMNNVANKNMMNMMQPNINVAPTFTPSIPRNNTSNQSIPQITIPNPANNQPFYGQTITEQDLINQSMPDASVEKEKIKKFLSTLNEEDQLLAMLDPEGFIDTTLKNRERTADQKNYFLGKDDPEFAKFFAKVNDLDPAFIYEKKSAERSAEQGFPLGFSLTDSEKEQDSVFQKEFGKFMSGGKLQKELANLNAYDSVLTNLENAIKGGTDMTGVTLGLMPDAFRAMVNPQAQDNFDTLRGVVMQSLKETLGGQFTEREGQKLIEAAYNPLLSEEINYKRVERLRDATVGRVVNRLKKKKYFDSEVGKVGDKNFKPSGTLKGYDYSLDVQAMDYRISDIENEDGTLKISESDLAKISDAMIYDLFDISDYENMTEQEFIDHFQKRASEQEQNFIQDNQDAIYEFLQKKGGN